MNRNRIATTLAWGLLALAGAAVLALPESLSMPASWGIGTAPDGTVLPLRPGRLELFEPFDADQVDDLASEIRIA
jgi:hypothetical protein